MSFYSDIQMMILRYCKLARAQVDNIMSKHKSFCHLEEIDIVKKIILIHCRGVTLPIKFTFDEIIRDVVMISNLLSQHTSLVGYYYGRDYYNSMNDKNNHNETVNFEFSFRDSEKRYKILFQGRHGKISYLDKVTQTTHAKLAINILATLSLISEFDSIEACYIGILAGIFVSKNRDRIKVKTSPNPPLTLIK